MLLNEPVTALRQIGGGEKQNFEYAYSAQGRMA